jgi:hypothetical protein
MNPIDQTRFNIGEPLEGAPANCFAAAIASILEVSLSAVPDEADFWKPGMGLEESGKLYEPAVHAWLRERGYLLICVDVVNVFYAGAEFDPFCILSGLSPRNPKVHHAIVARGNKPVHDPHPSRDYLAGDPNKWMYELFVPVNAGALLSR